MQMATKHENHEILVIIIKHVNHPRTPKQWAVAHENAHKTRKYEFWVMPSNIYQVLTVVVNHRGITKLWAITHYNVYKTRKRRVFGHNSQTCKSPWKTKTMGNSSWIQPKMRKWRVSWHTSQTSKSPWNPKTMGNSSWKQPQNAKTTSFWSYLSNM